jgi:hypothetical protein
MKKTIPDTTKFLKLFNDSLQKLMDNPEGGKLTIEVENGQKIIFTYPPLKDRPKYD